MLHPPKKTYLLFLFIIFITSKGFSQLSKTHYIPPLTSSEFENANPGNQYLYLSTPSNSDVFYKVTLIGQSNSITGVVSNDKPIEIPIGSSKDQLFITSTATSTIVNDRGYIIEAEGAIYVSVRMEAGDGAQAGALVSKGISALDTTFRIGTYTNAAPKTDYLSFVSVMATEDNTIVNFRDLPSDLIIENYSGPFPFSTILNKGESYIVAVNSFDQTNTTNRGGLIGALVTSNKNIVVNCGSTNGSFHNGTGRDYGIDQIVGESKIGNEYIFVKGDGDNNWENILIVAHHDNTIISINGSSTPITTIEAGEYYVIQGDMYNINGNMYVESSQDVFAYQGIGALGNNGMPSEANQGLFFVPPLSCEARGNIDNIPHIENIGNTTYSGGITIVTKIGATVNVIANETERLNIGSPNTVTGNPDYVTYKITDIVGDISIEGNDELYCAYFNSNGRATSGSFYSGFATIPEIQFVPNIASLGNCIPNITLGSANIDSFDTYEWFFDDGSGLFKTTGIRTPNFPPKQPGKYKLKGTITCSGTILESEEIAVSICPDDIDNDGIIDNIDIDNDNDGIPNCTESKGNITIDIVNTNSPDLIFQDNTNNKSIISSSSTGFNVFSGDKEGYFTSTMDAGNGVQGKYTLSFTELINFKFSQNTTTPNVNTNTAGEFFIIQILPANKNITLVDPDNQLLVDTDFDGDFEAGVTMISSSEIHFKINPNSNGNTPYQFLANQINEFSFIHKLTNLTQSSTFTGQVSLTCYKNDNDGDGIKDDIDLDSDNDGVPDILEGTYTWLELDDFNIDANGDGLKDIFENEGLLDSDNDGVYNFYDLDSDNDGIYDLVESGYVSFISDINNDGIVDGSTFGINGWTDNVETAPDSNAYKQFPDDLDKNSFFNLVDSDSDGDGCSDVIEAGFSDVNMDDYLGDGTVITNSNGLVTNTTNGYTTPNLGYSVPGVEITTQPEDIIQCEDYETTISVVVTTFEVIQWQVSIDGINWVDVVDDAIYTNSQLSDLTIFPTPLSFNKNKYRAAIKRNSNSCDFFSDEITLTVIPSPLTNTPNLYIQCDDATNDQQAFFNLTLDRIKAEINPDYIEENLVFTYYDSQGFPITAPSIYKSFSSFVTIRIQSSNECFREVRLDLVVSLSPPNSDLNLYTPDQILQCDDGIDTRDGISTFDMTNIHDHISNTIFAGLNVSVHFYENQVDAELENNEIQNISSYKNINSPDAQSIWVRVKDVSVNDCLGLKEFKNILTVPPIPDFTVNTTEILCVSDINSSVDLEVNKANVLENFDYEWLFTNSDGSIADQFISNEENITVSVPGTYSITLKKTDGARCPRTEQIVVTTSEIATITQQDVTIVDISKNNSVIINTTNLGFGNYKFALREEGSNFINYQDEPVFENVKAGFYTIYVNDPTCGSATLPISVIGHAKYFTPNGDGNNDYWKIKGIDTSHQPNSRIHIYDRYGKFLKQISTEELGWDGTFNGENMPSDDYWFRVLLQDGRTFKGHFTLKRAF